MNSLFAWSLLTLFPVPTAELVISVDPWDMISADEESSDDEDLNSWLQQGIRVTNQPLDVAIAGQGFFQLIDGASGTVKLTRDGRFSINAEGLLVHKVYGDQVLMRTASGVSSISMGDAEKIVDSNTGITAQLNSIEVTESGHLMAHYSNGEARDIAAFAIQTFEHPRALKRIGGHLFTATVEAGIARYDAANICFGGSLEELDERTYEVMNLGLKRRFLF